MRSRQHQIRGSKSVNEEKNNNDNNDNDNDDNDDETNIQ